MVGSILPLSATAEVMDVRYDSVHCNRKIEATFRGCVVLARRITHPRLRRPSGRDPTM